MSHGQTSVEREFSHNKTNMTPETIISKRMIKRSYAVSQIEAPYD